VAIKQLLDRETIVVGFSIADCFIVMLFPANKEQNRCHDTF
jgi:hypothetical protein